MKTAIIVLLTILVIPAIGAAHAQTANEVDIQTGAGSSANAACVTTNNCFSPNPLTVAPGTTVTWTNNDQLAHTVTSGKVSDSNSGSLFDSGLIGGTTKTANHTFQFTFANAGTYDYYCTVHPWMIGQVIVGASQTIPTPTPQPTPSTISITTDKQSYNQGDTIIISGKVSSIIQHTAVTLRIFNSHDDPISTAQLLPSSDGSFTKTILATGPLWADAGTYTITYQYGSLGTPSNQTFYYNGGDGSSTVTKAINSTYSLQTGGQTYSIPYIIKGGTVSSMNVLAQQYTLEATMNTNADGSLTVMLPRSLIDAKSVNSDINFIVTVNGVSITQFTETTNPTVRVLSIPFHNGDTKIDIIGTQIAGSSVSNPTNTSTGTTTVTTDKTSYNDGDNITISGTVSSYIANTPMTIRIINPIGNLVKVDSIGVESDRTFSTSITATGTLWQAAGAYHVVAEYGSPDRTAQTTFQFSGSSSGQSGNTIKVGGADLPVKYSITNGQVLGIKADTQSKSLIVSIQTTGDGVLTITLPRALINATLPTGQNYKYNVLVDGQEADFQETSTTTTDRTLSILFTDGTKKIEIVGTSVVGNRISSTPSNPYLGCTDCNSTSNIQQIPPITITTDKPVYDHHSQIIIIGRVANPDQSHEIGIRITSPSGNVVTSSQLTLDNNGYFHAKVSTVGNLWFENGQYTITVQQGDEQARVNSVVFQLAGVGPIIASSPMTVLTDKPSYNAGDSIVISGQVSSIIQGKAVSIQILEPDNNLSQMILTYPSQDGKYSTTITSTGEFWKQSGIFTLQAQYTSDIIAPPLSFYFNFGNVSTLPVPNPQSTHSLEELLKQRMEAAKRLQELLHSQNTDTNILIPQPASVFTPTQQDIQNINQAKANQTIAAEVNVGSNQSETRSIDNSVSLQTTNAAPDSLGVKVSAPDQTGPKVIVFNLNATTINVANLKDLGVMYDGKLISPAPNMGAILHAKSTDNPSFAIVVTQSGVQVLVLVPHFSTHTIILTNMSKAIPTVPEFGPIVGIVTIISLIGSIVTSRRFFKT